MRVQLIAVFLLIAALSARGQEPRSQRALSGSSSATASDAAAQVLAFERDMESIGESPMVSGMPPETHKRIMHVTLQIGDQVLQGADAPLGQFTEPAGFCVATEFDDVADGERVFAALAQDGQVQMPFQETFWAKGFVTP